MDAITRVRTTTAEVMKKAAHVKISSAGVEGLAKDWGERAKSGPLIGGDVGWSNCGWHYEADVGKAGPATAQYVFVLDALNFCFWPTPGLEYVHLALGLKAALTADPEAFSARALQAVTPQKLLEWVPDFAIPEPEERCQKLQELGAVLEERFQGLAANLVAAAGGSAVKLVDLITAYLPGFRDESVYRGRQCFFYKRAQILVGDLWAAYGQQVDTKAHPFAFTDMPCLTMFADYRVPQILVHVGVLDYSTELSQRIAKREEIASGSEEEVEIRAATVVAVEKIKEALGKQLLLLDEAAADTPPLLSVEVDWLLWHEGEAMKEEMLPHHRTRTVFY